MPNGGGRGWVPLMHLFIPNVIKSYHVGQFGIKFTTLLTIMVIKKKRIPFARTLAACIGHRTHLAVSQIRMPPGWKAVFAVSDQPTVRF
jgi:hypothetical protein